MTYLRKRYQDPITDPRFLKEHAELIEKVRIYNLHWLGKGKNPLDITLDIMEKLTQDPIHLNDYDAENVARAAGCDIG